MLKRVLVSVVCLILVSSFVHAQPVGLGKIHFKKSIRISTEHGNQNDTPANYSSLVYYYYIPQ